MNICNMNIFLGLLECTSNILSIMKQSKALLHIDNPYGVVWPLSFSILFNVGYLRLPLHNKFQNLNVMITLVNDPPSYGVPLCLPMRGQILDLENILRKRN